MHPMSVRKTPSFCLSPGDRSAFRFSSDIKWHVQKICCRFRGLNFQTLAWPKSLPLACLQ